MSRLTIRLLGPFEVRLGDALVTDFAYDKVRALLAYLVAETGRPQRRERLVGLLWPDYPERSARQNLSQALYTLRAAIDDASGPGEEPRFILATRQTVAFAPTADAWSDVAAFDAAIRATKAHPHADLAACEPCLARLAEAVALYRGDFLQDLALDDSEAFEAWSLAQREARHQQVLGALARLADRAEADGDYDRALALARRQIALEPWREAAHGQAMRALALGGHRAAALAQFEACRHSLIAELGVQPDPRTQELCERIRAGALQPPPRAGSDVTPSADPPRPGRPDAAATPRAAPPEMRPTAPLPATVAAPEDERRWITLVLADVAGSHDLLQQEGAETWVEVLGSLLDLLAGEARRLGGEFRQTGGDRARLTFGLTIAREDDAERAVLAALAMQQACAAHLREIGEERLALRVSVHRGEAIVTSVDGRPTAMGELFTSAQQVHASLALGATWVDAATHDLAAAAFSWQPLDGGYCPLAHRHTVDKGRGLPGLDAPFIGRDRELHALQAALSSLQRGIGGIVTIVGEAGIGKSRLVAEARKAWGEPTWVEGRCLSYATQTAFRMWVDVLRALAGVAAETPPIEVREALRRAVEGLYPERFDDIYPLLAWLMALPLDAAAQARLRGIDAEGLRVLAFRAVEGFLAGAAARSPLVIALEDLHWADATSLRLLEALLPLTERLPLLFLCVMRPETDHPCWQIRELVGRDYRHRHTHLQLVPLNDAESASLVAHLLTVDDLPVALRARLLARAEGNPFFLEELLRALIDTGAIAFDAETGRRHATRDIAGLPLPATLHGVLAARIDRLPLEARQLLQVAAVIGRIVPFPLLASVVGHDALDDALRTLQRAELLRERARLPEVELIFKHQLTQEAAYAGLLTRKRRALHGRVAEAIEQRDVDRIDERLGLLAHHWEQAGDAERAVTYLRRAGEQAAARFANEEAVGFFGRALALTPDSSLEQRYDLLLHLEALYNHLGRRESQREILDRLQSAAEALNKGEPTGAEALAEVWYRRARLASLVSEFDEAISAAQQTISLAHAAESIRHEALGHLIWGSALRGIRIFRQAPVEGITERLAEAIDFARKAELPDVQAQALREMGLDHTEAGDHSEALDTLGQCLALYRQTGDRTGECLAHTATAMTRWWMGDLDVAESIYLDALEMIRRTGHIREEGWALWGLAGIAATQGLLERSLAWLGPAYQAFNTVDDGWGALLVENMHQAMYTALGQYEEAERWGMRLVRRDASGFRALARCHLSTAALYRGDAQAALTHGSQALAEAQACSAWLRAWASLVTGNARVALGDHDAAAMSYTESLELRDSVNSPSPDALAGLADVAMAQERAPDALGLVDRALAYLDTVPFWNSAHDPSRVYLTCWRVLQANGDVRAQAVLEKAYCAIRDIAGQIEDEALRRSFLENVPANREIVAAWEATR